MGLHKPRRGRPTADELLAAKQARDYAAVQARWAAAGRAARP